MICVYVLISLKDSSEYVGMSGELKIRLRYHNSGKVRSTKNRKPWKVSYIKEFETRDEARVYEKYLKSSAGRRSRKRLRLKDVGS